MFIAPYSGQKFVKHKTSKTKRLPWKKHFLFFLFLILYSASSFAQELVKDIQPGLKSSQDSTVSMRLLQQVNGTLFFTVRYGIDSLRTQSGIWQSDGTAGGTTFLCNLLPQSIAVVDSSLYFFASSDSTPQYGLWKYDLRKKTKGIHFIKELYPSQNTRIGGEIEILNGLLFFFVNGKGAVPEFWRSDGTEKGTFSLQVTGTVVDNLSFIPFKGNMYFSGYKSETGLELWKSDGTLQGTQLVKDINKSFLSNGNTKSSNPENLVEANGTLYFTAADILTNRELWKTDGSAAGTQLVKEIQLGPLGSFPSELTNVNGTLFFSAHSGAMRNRRRSRAKELWKSDGTAAGTVRVTQLKRKGASAPSSLVNVNGTLFFSMDDGKHGRELWASNGKRSGTHMVKDINRTKKHCYTCELLKLSDTLLQKRKLKDLNRIKKPSYCRRTFGSMDAPAQNQTNSVQLLNVNGVLYFVASDGVRGKELWKSDGTFAGTSIVRDIKPFLDYGSYPSNLVCINGVLYFVANDGPHGIELWKLDVQGGK